jgi:uncharacterized protein (TIGR02677 family)
VEETVGRTGSLQTTMLRAIRDLLREIGAGAQRDELAPEALARKFHDLFAAFDTLTNEASRFLADLHRYLGGDRADEDQFVARKRAVLAYVGQFINELHRLADEIEEHLASLDDAATGRLLAVAAGGADLPPALDGGDPVAAWTARQRQRWDGLRGWFLQGAQGEAPRVQHLNAVAVESVVGLTRALARLNDRRTRPVDRAADFRTLARWFAACPGDAEAHVIWAAAFGLYPSRHFQIAEADEEVTATSASWWGAPAVEVPVRLRSHGRVTRVGRTAAAADYSGAREWLAQVRRRERQQLEGALRRFRGVGPLWLREIATLDEAEFDLLLALLDEALSTARGPNGVRRTQTADGALVVTLTPPAPADDEEVVLRTPRGRLRCRNYRLDVADAVTGRAFHARPEREVGA